MLQNVTRDFNLEERKIRADMPFICNNPVRASIIYLLMKQKESDYCCTVEEISTRLGKNHSIVLHHLEKLLDYNIVEVVRSVPYGNKQKRRVWGLNLKMVELIKEIYSYIVRFCFTQRQLEKMCNVNKKIR